MGPSLHTGWVSPMGPAAGAIELLNSSSKIHGCGDLVTDLLLEKIRLEEAAQRQKFDGVSFPKIPSGLDSHR